MRKLGLNSLEFQLVSLALEGVRLHGLAKDAGWMVRLPAGEGFLGAAVDTDLIDQVVSPPRKRIQSKAACSAAPGVDCTT